MKNQINIYLEEACRKGLDEGVFYGVSAAVSLFKDKGYQRGWYSGGTTRFDSERAFINRKTLFDLASLTKPLCTTLSVLHLIATEKLDWEESCVSLLELESTKEIKGIKIKDILSHSSGMTSYKPYFKQFPAEYSKNNNELLIDKILKEPLEYQTGTLCQYSDLGFILLGALLEKKIELGLDTLFRTIVTDPLQISSELLFLPFYNSPLVNKQTVAATEKCGWRKKIMQGEVHDEHCWLMGGVAGHAGLFGTSGAVMTLCESLLDSWKDRGSHPAFSNKVLQYAVTVKHRNGSWCLGFDTPSPGTSSSGSYFAPNSVGHLGFSGTSFWIDPEKDLIVVLLTNRIHPSRENTKIRQFRPFFHDYLMKRILSD